MLDKIKETTDYIKNLIDGQPQIGIILGTGLGALVNEINIKLTFSYE
jgi:purine-nucleoside phosphorylase